MLMLGKALGNGYAITAVLGKKIMQSITKTLLVVIFGPKVLVRPQR